MRQVVLDIESTHLDNKIGRITEIGIVEIVDYEATGNTYHCYINPIIEVSQESVDITGLTNQFLSKFNRFDHYIESLLDFIGDSDIIAHNASFDIGYINAELKRYNYEPLKNKIIDTLEIAKKIYRVNNSLNSLCNRFKINKSNRIKHGALIDADLLHKVYYYLVHNQKDITQSNLLFQDNFVKSKEIDDDYIKRKRILFS